MAKSGKVWNTGFDTCFAFFPPENQDKEVCEKYRFEQICQICSTCNCQKLFKPKLKYSVFLPHFDKNGFQTRDLVCFLSKLKGNTAIPFLQLVCSKLCEKKLVPRFSGLLPFYRVGFRVTDTIFIESFSTTSFERDRRYAFNRLGIPY